MCFRVEVGESKMSIIEKHPNTDWFEVKIFKKTFPSSTKDM